ncbi:MAG: SET domain-containing protein [Minisyncoccia bacterium]
MRIDDSQIPSRFEVRDGRPGTGLGLYAKVAFKKDDFLLEYTGKKIPTAVADESDSAYLFELNSDWTIDGPPQINPAGYINHDCHPNTETDIIDGRIIFEAIKDIAVGEELTVDYGDEYFDEFIRPFGCKCASCEKGLVSPHFKAAQ